MSIVITHPETEEDVTVFVAINGGYVDCICRAESQEAWEAAALADHLLSEDAQGNLIPIEGATIDVLGPVELAPAVLDAQGDVVTPAVMDERYHVNLRLHPDLPWQPIAINWTENGIADPDNNAGEQALLLDSVALIDPDTVASAARGWL